MVTTPAVAAPGQDEEAATLPAPGQAEKRDAGLAAIAPAARPLSDKHDRSAEEYFAEARRRLSALVRSGVAVDRYAAQASPPSALRPHHYFAQIGSFRSARAAESQLAATHDRFGSLYARGGAEVRSIDLGERGRFYRALIGPFASADSAHAMCRTLKQREQPCLILAQRSLDAASRKAPPLPTAWASIPYVAVKEGPGASVQLAGPRPVP
jgi:cell division protein FtsN